MYNALCLYNFSDVVYLFTFIGNGMNVNQKIMMKVQLTLIVSTSVDSNFRLSRIFIEVPNFVVYKYI